jgi:hypothetical protein
MAKLAEVETVFPHSTLIVVLTPAGELLASRAGGGSAFAALAPSEAGQLLSPIASLKKSAVQFGAALNQMECPVIHVRGNHTMFSCYDVDKNVSGGEEEERQLSGRARSCIVLWCVQRQPPVR